MTGLNKKKGITAYKLLLLLDIKAKHLHLINFYKCWWGITRITCSSQKFMQPTPLWHLNHLQWKSDYYYLPLQSMGIFQSQLTLSTICTRNTYQISIREFQRIIAVSWSFFITLPTKLHYIIRQHNCSLYFKSWFREKH